MKSIPLNTEKVKAIMRCNVTATRFAIKNKDIINAWDCEADGTPIAFIDQATGDSYPPTYPCPYHIGDILYVRETWAVVDRFSYNFGDWWSEYIYRATYSPDYKLDTPPIKWHPPINMPKEAARIFLCVTDVWVERLQDITEEQALAEGAPGNLDYPISPVYCPTCRGEGTHGALGANLGYTEVDCTDCNTAVKRFSHLWDSTIKPAERAVYGWDANPWVWVIEFEQISKEEAMSDG